MRTIRESVDSLSALTIQAVREIPEVKRVHVMAYRQEESVAQIVEQAGLLPRPKKKATVHGLDVTGYVADLTQLEPSDLCGGVFLHRVLLVLVSDDLRASVPGKANQRHI